MSGAPGTIFQAYPEPRDAPFSKALTGYWEQISLLAGRLFFGIRLGPDSWSLGQQAGWLLLVIFCTSLAAMGLALLVAAVARSEIQVALS